MMFKFPQRGKWEEMQRKDCMKRKAQRVSMQASNKNPNLDPRLPHTLLLRRTAK